MLKNISLIFFLLGLFQTANAAPANECIEAEFDKSLFGLCQAYLSGVNCLDDANKDTPRCVALRKNFAIKSGGKDIADILNGGGNNQKFTIGAAGGTAELQNAIKVIFPSGAFPTDTTVSLGLTSDTDINTLFDEFTVMFRPSGRLSYEARIGTGIEPPLSETVQVDMQVPNNLVSATPQEYGIEVFVMIEQGAEDETPYAIFELIPSTYDSTNQIISFELPGAAFSNNAYTQNEYQAVVTLAPTPGVSSPVAQNQIQTTSFLTLSATATASCQAASIKCPVAGGCTVTSPYNKARKHPKTGAVRPHYGADYKAATGTNLTSAADGKVERSYTSSSYGETVIVRHTDGGATLYAHLENRSVNKGDVVKAGETIGTADSTGLSTGPHLHFEYVPNGQLIKSKNRIDPDACIDALASGSVNVRDSGSLADDAFAVSIDGFNIGQTTVGGSNTLAISNLKPGSHTLGLAVIVAPDNVGTYTVTLNDGLKFSDGTTSKTGSAPLGSFLTWSFNVPQI